MSTEARADLVLDPTAIKNDAPDPEVAPVARRRRFTAQYKLQILRDADRCRESGELGALLRREGLYSSHLVTWRAARERGELGARGSRPLGRKADPDRVLHARIAQLENENARLREKLDRAEGLIEVQKNSPCCWT